MNKAAILSTYQKLPMVEKIRGGLRCTVQRQVILTMDLVKLWTEIYILHHLINRNIKGQPFLNDKACPYTYTLLQNKH